MNENLNLLLSRARKGDEESISELLKKYRPMLEKAVGRSYAGLGDAGISYEDLMQEAMIALTRAVDSYDSGRGITFGAYARTCVNNSLVSIARKVFSSRRQKLPAGDAERRAPDSREALELLDGLGLSRFERDVVMLRLRGYKPADISRTLGKPVKSIYNAICRIKGKAAGIEL